MFPERPVLALTLSRVPEEALERAKRVAALGLSLGLGALALSAWLFPHVLAARFRVVDDGLVEPSRDAAFEVVRTLPLPLLSVALLVAVRAFPFFKVRPHVAFGAGATLLAASYWSLSGSLSNWIVDDAAITFAYSENLARGHGLVLHPNHLPEEGYSSTLWMLMLAFGRILGAEIPALAKEVSALVGAACVVLAAWVAERASGKPLRASSAALFAVIALGAPFVIWSMSGLEHGLQALAFVLLVALAGTAKRWLASSVVLAALVLLRPEAPLFVATIGTVYVARAWRASGVRAAIPAAVVILVPFLVWAVMLAFRLAYFGDPLPNPYYAKATDASLARLFNPIGGSWGYVMDWLSSSGALVLIALLALGRYSGANMRVVIAVTVLATQLVFVIAVGGDWMSAHRFVAPVLPVLAILCVYARETVSPRLGAVNGLALVTVSSAVLGLGVVSGLHRFRTAPTTPTAAVEQVGYSFRELSSKLGIETPVLAHHDAGGTSFASRLDLLDLAGLGNRTIAKNMFNREFVRFYVFEQKRPTYIFGSAEKFPASTGFKAMPEFQRDYVSVEFSGRDYMAADLCHIRRDVVRDVPGVHVLRDEAGQITKLVVH